MDLGASAGHNRARMENLDTALRLIGIGQLVLVALVVWRSGAGPAVRRVTVALLIGVIGYLINSAPQFPQTPSPTRFAVVLASNLAPWFLWLFAHVVFDRAADRRIAGASIALILASVMIFVLRRWCEPLIPLADAVGHLTAALLVIHAMAIAVRERDDDLVEQRRRFRVAFVLVIAVLSIGVLASEAWFGFGHEPVWMLASQSVVIALAILGIGVAMLEADPALLAPPRAPGPTAPNDDWSPAERVLAAKLNAAMEARVWLEPGLTIGMLAARLDVPEHRLRALINRRLGHRNFSAFLNAYRIAEAKAVLADPVRVDLPVLTIAMDLGYGSLAPFNRAFRESVGQTPTEFRRQAFADPEKD
ncbi:MAG: helix-turn-helix domain-containing protein [Novosphingobium sp.]|uniref:AraC family transcriptional regulator n=1 Tax=Novosphingobium sp. NDB2Meth1 TaxID=1892847 RepID=UPI0009F970F4|nr:helix-turn-helix domain-containing protein [Novosphingobium sp. NDB2Meth1]MBY0392448.1 helix-turn-helix domain-containing protein [Novosphingobium sp.]